MRQINSLLFSAHVLLKKGHFIIERRSLKRVIDRVWLECSSRLKDLNTTIVAQAQSELDRACDIAVSGDLTSCRRARKALYAWSLRLPRRRFQQLLRNFFRAVCFAVLGAVAIRSCWFELYHVPTGSMRPTILEQDRLIVTKTAFGLNRPLSAVPLLFDSNLLERGQIVTFTSQSLDVEGKTLHFGLLPGFKRFVKRLWAKGGDLVYFYGGEIFILDELGNSHCLPGGDPKLAQLEIIPLVNFQGRVKESDQEGRKQLTHTHFGIEMTQELSGALPWGMDHYALGRIARSSSVPTRLKVQGPQSELWLHLLHHPRHLPKTKKDRLLPQWTLHESYLPLNDQHIASLRRALSTSRFSVKNGLARRVESSQTGGVRLTGVPDGTYEFCRGIAQSIGFGGNAKVLPKTHSLYGKEFFPKLFNAGFDFAQEQDVMELGNSALPLRSVYYRDGDLRCMSTILMERLDAHLVAFKKSEERRKRQNAGYLPFLDEKAPWMFGEKIDLQSMQKWGLRIPRDRVLVLGDNTPRSSDSRDFGFVPQTNIEGSPLSIFWPLSSAKKHMDRPSLPFLTPYRLIIWASVACFATSHYFARIMRMNKTLDQRPWRSKNPGFGPVKN